MEVQQVLSAFICLDEDEETILGQFVDVSRVKLVGDIHGHSCGF
jgi:hypothetical protein